MNNRLLTMFICFGAAAAVILLVFFNRCSSAGPGSGQLAIEAGGKDISYEYDESVGEYQTFDTKMTRKNGDVFDKNYSGIELSAILSRANISVTPEMTVRAVCADNYEIELTGAEILDPGNIYIVTRESGEPLGEDDGPFMMVINHDEFSTRWARQLVKIIVK